MAFWKKPQTQPILPPIPQKVEDNSTLSVIGEDSVRPTNKQSEVKVDKLETYSDDIPEEPVQESEEAVQSDETLEYKQDSTPFDNVPLESEELSEEDKMLAELEDKKQEILENKKRKEFAERMRKAKEAKAKEEELLRQQYSESNEPSLEQDNYQNIPQVPGQIMLVNEYEILKLIYNKLNIIEQRIYNLENGK